MQALKNAKISAMILAKMSEGMDIQQAFDAIMGEGAYLKLAHEVYEALRAKNA